MSTRPWIFTINTFEVNTADSNEKMLSIATDTEAKLQAESADPDINILYTSYFPVYDAYRQIQINYDVAAGNRKGKTLNLENLMKIELPKEIRKWEGFVRSIYTEDSPEELEIFPNKRDPFLQGTYEQRISAIGTLATRLAADSNASIQGYAPTVLSFYNLIFSARDTEQNKEGVLGILSDTREQQRKLLATELFGVLGGLMRKFKSDPLQAARFFDLSLLRETGDEPKQRMKGRIANAENGNPLSLVKGTIKDADGVQVGESFFTDVNAEYNKATDHFGQGTLELEKPGFQKKAIAIDVPEDGTLVQDASLQPIVLPPSAA